MSDKIHRYSLLLLFFFSPFLFASFYTSAAFGQEASDTIRVKFNQLWIDYDVTQAGERGMLIHVNLTLYHLTGVTSSLAVAVEFKNGDKVFAGNPEYRSTNGQLTVYRELNNRFDSSLYSDLQIFIPYREFSVGAGSQELRLHADILYGDGGNLHVTYYNFSFTK